jgi:hypothetical protein
MRCAQCRETAPPGARFCAYCGVPLAPPVRVPERVADLLGPRSDLPGERKHVSVLFADVTASMAVLTSHDAEEAAALFDQVASSWSRRCAAGSEPGAGRWDHGAVRRARSPGRPRDPRVLRRASDAAADHRIRRRRAAGPWDPDPDPRGPQLRRGRAAAPRLRPVGALRGRADRPPGVAPRAARQARHRAREYLHRRHDGPPRAHAGDRPRQRQGPCRARRGVRGGRRRQLDAARGVGSPRAITPRRT